MDCLIAALKVVVLLVVMDAATKAAPAPRRQFLLHPESAATFRAFKDSKRFVCSLRDMRLMLVAMALSVLVLWDLSANRGGYTRPVSSFVYRVLNP